MLVPVPRIPGPWVASSLEMDPWLCEYREAQCSLYCLSCPYKARVPAWAGWRLACVSSQTAKRPAPPGALSWWSHFHQEPSWTVWYFPQRGLVQPALLKIRKLGPGRGRACLTVVVCKDSGSRLRSRFCPLGHLPATAAFQVLRTPLGKTLS